MYEFLKEKAPHIAKAVAELLPNAGVLGFVKNLVQNDEAIKQEDKDLIFQEITKEQLERAKIELEDRKSAREREISITKSGAFNWTQNILAIAALVSFITLCFYVLVERTFENSESAGWTFGIVTFSGTLVTNVYGYYFGSSKGSQEKNNFIQTLTKNKHG